MATNSNRPTKPELALEGCRVLDLAQTGPSFFCSMILGDLGADIIKVVPPPQAGARVPGLGSKPSALFRQHPAYDVMNRNKRCMAVNLKSEKGREVFLKMAASADVIVEAFKPGVVKKLGIDYGAVKAVNKGIVYCSLAGYGQTGPYSQLAGHDMNYISMAGVLGLIGTADGPPIVPLNLVADYGSTPIYGAVGILAALMARQRTGAGQYIDISFMDSSLSLLSMLFSRYFAYTGAPPKRGQMQVGGAYPYYAVYRTRDDKYISLGCVEPHFWERLCRFLGEEGLIPFSASLDHYFSRPEEKWKEIASFLEKTFATRTRDEWFDLLIAKDIPVGKVYDLEEVPGDPQVQYRQMFIDAATTDDGVIKQVGMPIKMSGTPCRLRRLAPTAGEHTDEVLNGLGYTAAQIKALREAQVIF